MLPQKCISVSKIPLLHQPLSSGIIIYDFTARRQNCKKLANILERKQKLLVMKMVFFSLNQQVAGGTDPCLPHKHATVVIVYSACSFKTQTQYSRY